MNRLRKLPIDSSYLTVLVTIGITYIGTVTSAIQKMPISDDLEHRSTCSVNCSDGSEHAGTAGNWIRFSGVCDMRQDKEKYQEQADLWKGYRCMLPGMLLFVKSVISTFFQNHIVSVYVAKDRTERRFFPAQILQRPNGRDTD